ncbi:capsule assembly Wzi family protein [Larkinella rosea]|uniref:Capsule assembly Wzi family protein n=1 Tax=Larkinella rosea TaxID=2025312 RepID=A0A3P1BTG8_9BACT|nr:capsule assembly Wzi family protein [Larkinella rosea]RRB04209.1 hypothetical protein EHT25_11860 [Larkinella rosea]
MKKRYGFLLLILSHQINAQNRINPYMEAGGLASSATNTPFWLRSNQFGIVPSQNPIVTVRAGVFGAVSLVDTSQNRRAWTLDYRAEVVGNTGKVTQLLLPEAYIRVTHRALELVAGRRREVIGLVDTTLSTGSWSWSGNALPMTKIRFGTNGFTPLWRNGWLGVNAFIAHGWFANTDYMQHSFLHQKSTIWRLGKPSWGFRLYAGINHNAQWGGKSAYLDPNLAVNGQLPGRLSDFGMVFLTIQHRNKQGGANYTNFDGYNRVGNHLGSYDFGLEIPGKTHSLFLYHQHPFEDSSGMIFANLPDGLTGIKLHRAVSSDAVFQVKDLLLEMLLTKSQSGSFLDLYGLSTLRRGEGRDNYFNNSQYREGWAYQNRILGSPFITRYPDITKKYQDNSTWIVTNNRIQVFHAGLRARVAGRVDLLAKLSYSINYGTYDVPYSEKPRQLSSLMQLGIPVNWLGGSVVTAAVSADAGQLYDNSVGGFLSIRKTWTAQNR